MTGLETVDERLRAVERAISDGDADDVALTDPRGELTERIESLESDVADLDAAVQAIRGYVGHVRSLDESVEQEADSALAAVTDLQERIERLETNRSAEPPRSARSEERPDPSPPGQAHDQSAIDHGRPSTDGGSQSQQYDTQRRFRSDSTNPPSHCRCCGSPGCCPSARSPGEKRDRRPEPDHDRPPGTGESGTDGAPVENVDEGGLVDRLRGKL